MKLFKIVCLLLFLFTNAFSQTGEKTAKISCEQVKQLIELASKNFEGSKLGKKEQVADPGFDIYYSNKSFGLEGKTTIDVMRNDESHPALYTSLYFGIDGNRSKIEYSKLVLEFDECLLKLGFQKKSEKKKDVLGDLVERTIYTNFDNHTDFNISLGPPFYVDAINGVPVKYVPYDLIELQVSHWD